jgi:hypothetical protein
MHAPILDSDHAPDNLTPDDPSWAAACAEFAAHAKQHAENMDPDRIRAAAFIFIDAGGTVCDDVTSAMGGTICDDVLIHGDRAPLIAALRAMLAALEASDV